VRLVEALGGASAVLTLGPAEAEEQLRDMMAIGIDQAIHLVTDGQEWDPQGTAAAITDAVRGQTEPYDLLLFGNESADAANFQVAIRVAHALGLPCVTGVKALSVHDGHVRCEQEVPGGRDVYEVPLPAVVTVKEGINLPRYPSLPGRLRAKRAPVETSAPDYVPEGLRKQALRVPETSKHQAAVLGEGADAVPALVKVLEEWGVLS
jgi:electron transfer flavoprotein beta subunit